MELLQRVRCLHPDAGMVSGYVGAAPAKQKQARQNEEKDCKVRVPQWRRVKAKGRGGGAGQRARSQRRVARTPSLLAAFSSGKEGRSRFYRYARYHAGRALTRATRIAGGVAGNLWFRPTQDR